MTRNNHTTSPETRTTTISIPQLRAALNGRLIAPSDAGYDQARTVLYGGIDRRPSLIARVANAADVARVIALARESGLTLAVRSGGHSLAGHSVSDGGIVLDLSDMKALSIDPERRTAWAETGLTAGEYTTATAAYGLPITCNVKRESGRILEQFAALWHRAGVQNHTDAAPPGAERANHLALTIHGLESQDCRSGIWLVDVGLGDALHQPIPLHEGTYVQGPFRYHLRRSEVEPAGWRLDHDPLGSFAGMDFRVQVATMDEFSERHLYLSTSPDSGFVRTCCVMRRDATGIDMLRGCMLGRIGTSSAQRTLETQAEWFAALADVFDLPLVDLDATDRNALWNRVQRAHESWLEAQKQAGASS